MRLIQTIKYSHRLCEKLEGDYMADKSKLIKKTEYKNFLSRLKNEIVAARQNAYKTVNRQLVELYLNIGEGIYEKVEISKWGQGVVETLSMDLGSKL